MTLQGFNFPGSAKNEQHLLSFLQGMICKQNEGRNFEFHKLGWKMPQSTAVLDHVATIRWINHSTRLYNALLMCCAWFCQKITDLDVKNSEVLGIHNCCNWMPE